MIFLKKRLGQHFLKDNNIINKIVRYINPLSNDSFIEIGPGNGALTLPLSKKIKSLKIVEKDKRLIPNLKKIFTDSHLVKIINEDILKYNFKKNVSTNTRLVGNLPYNISTEIIFRIIEAAEKIKDSHFMLQKEVVNRMIAKSGTKEYGRLSIMTQVYFDIKKLFDIPPTVFRPQPKVMSSYVRLIPKKYSFKNKNHEKKFKEIVTAAFIGRRKMIKSSLKDSVSEKDFIKLDIDVNLRPENLTVYDFLKIADIL